MAGSGNGSVLVSAPTEAPPISPVVCLSLGHSALRRLVELAELEGIDVSTLATNLLMYELGQRMVQVRARLARASSEAGLNTTVAAVCMLCARERQDAREPRCPACGGAWIAGVR